MIYKKTFRLDDVPIYGITLIAEGYEMDWEYYTEQERDENWKEIIKKEAK